MIESNTIGYCGFAKIKKMRGKHVIQEYTFHNNGTPFLFKSLAATLCGQVKTQDMPKYLDFGHTKSEVYYPFVTNRVPLTSRYVENYSYTDTDGSDGSQRMIAKVAAVFSAYIPSTIIKSTSDAQGALLTDVNTLALYSLYSLGDNRSSKVAEINISNIDGFDINSTQDSYLIEWVMTFSNVVSGVSSTQGGNI